MERGDVLPGDAVAFGGKRHRLLQRDGGRLRHILLRALPEPARRGQTDRRIGLFGIAAVESVEYPGNPRTQATMRGRSANPPLRRVGCCSA